MARIALDSRFTLQRFITLTMHHFQRLGFSALVHRVSERFLDAP
jgi:hypothetical protein